MVYPSCVSASAHFSPSTQIILSDLIMSGMLYSGLVSGSLGNCLNSFLVLPSASRVISPVSLRSRYLRTLTSISPSADR